MDAFAEGEVWLCFAIEPQGVRVIKDLGVAVRGSEEKSHGNRGLQGRSMQDDRVGNPAAAAGRDVERARVAKQLFDRGTGDALVLAQQRFHVHRVWVELFIR